MKRKIVVVLAALLMASPAFAKSYETPLSPQARMELAEELASDSEFADLYMKKLLEQVATISVEQNQAMSGMLPPEPPAPARKVEILNQPSAGMVGDDPFVIPETPSILVDGQLPPKSKNLKSPVSPALGGAKNVDLFLSLTCDWCKKLWENLRKSEVTRNHLLEDSVNIWILPRTDGEAAFSMLFEYIEAKNPEKAMEFVDACFNNDFSGNDAQMFSEVDQWLGANGIGSLKELRDNRKLVDAIGSKLKKGLERASELDVQGYPSVYADGKEDRSYFSKIINASEKK